MLGRKRKTESQVEILTISFKANPYPGIEEKHQLAKSLNISQLAIEKWFSNRRIKGIPDASECGNPQQCIISVRYRQKC